MSNEIQTIEVAELKQLPEAEAKDLQINFAPLFQKAQEWKQKAAGIKVVDINDKDGMKAAREARLELKNIRVDADKVRIKLKEESLLKGKAIDGLFNVIKYLIVPIEKNLEEQEKFAELQEERRLNELTEKRIAEISKYITNPDVYNFRIMSEEGYQELLGNSKKLWEIKQEEEKKAEAARIEAEKQKAIEDERIRKENEKLRIENEKKQKALEEQKRKQAEKEAKIKAENDAKMQKQREIQEAKLKKEREAKEKLERELKAKRDKEEADKKEKAKLEAEKLAKEKAAKLAPDKDKLRIFAGELLAMDYPDVKSEEAQKIVAGIKELVKKVNIYIVENIENL